jgi:cobalamin biosynthesis protein CobD/CbiB
VLRSAGNISDGLISPSFFFATPPASSALTCRAICTNGQPADYAVRQFLR